MEIFKFFKDNEDYATSRGRWAKYFFNQSGDEGLIVLGETDDYFYFTLSLRQGALKDRYSINFSQDSILYKPLNNILDGFKLIDVLEEGTPERKSLCFAKGDGNIKLTFNLTQEERVFYTIEFANLRRLGDTRFKNLVDENGKQNQDIEIEREFRYKFKERLHNMLDELERSYNQQNTEIRLN